MEDELKRKSKNRGLYIRLAIYVPLIAYFGYGAIARYRAEQNAQPPGSSSGQSQGSGPKADPFEGLEAKEMVLPDGRVMPVYEVTPEQAEALGLTAADPSLADQPLPPPPPGGSTVSADGTAPAPTAGGDAKAEEGAKTPSTSDGASQADGKDNAKGSAP